MKRSGWFARLHPMSAVEFHDRIAPAFKRKYASSKAFQERFQVWTTLFAKYLTQTDQVLDLGCGTGVFSRYLALSGCTVTGIDGSAAMIALCEQSKPLTNVRYVMSTLPLADTAPYVTQDAVLMSSFLEYVADPTAMLGQVNILLRPNGLLFVSIPNQRSIYRVMEPVFFWLMKRPAYYQHSRYAGTETAFTQLLTTLGFDLIERVYFSSQDPVSRWLKRWLPAPYVNTLLVGVYRKVTPK